MFHLWSLLSSSEIMSINHITSLLEPLRPKVLPHGDGFNRFSKIRLLLTCSWLDLSDYAHTFSGRRWTVHSLRSIAQRPRSLGILHSSFSVLGTLHGPGVNSRRVEVHIKLLSFSLHCKSILAGKQSFFCSFIGPTRFSFYCWYIGKGTRLHQ